MTCKINLHNITAILFLQIDCTIFQINDIIHKCDLFKCHPSKIIEKNPNCAAHIEENVCPTLITAHIYVPKESLYYSYELRQHTLMSHNLQVVSWFSVAKICPSWCQAEAKEN